MSRVWICEKPSLAKEVANFLGKSARDKHCYRVGNEIITWCYGHLYEQASPEYYLADLAIPSADKKTKKISWSDMRGHLPIVPEKWHLQAKKDPSIKGQIKAISSYLKTAKQVINVGDPDREGQLLVDEVLDKNNINPDSNKVMRLWASSLDYDSLNKAMKTIGFNKERANLRDEALARARADWLWGMALTIAYTVDSNTLIKIGRVKTVVTALVVKRDLNIENFKPVKYYVPTLTIGKSVFRWDKCNEQGLLRQGMDEQGRIIDLNLAKDILKSFVGNVEIIESSAKEVSERPPLPHSLDTLQPYMNKTAGMSAKETLAAAQSLYEKHKATSYPRSDCQYLPKSMFDDVNKILTGLAKLPTTQQWVKKANTKLPPSAAFNDKKVTAHHAIIPTGVVPQSMDKQESKVFEAVSKFYLAQFYPDSIALQINVVMQAGQYQDQFKHNDKAILTHGWREIIGAGVLENKNQEVSAKPENVQTFNLR